MAVRKSPLSEFSTLPGENPYSSRYFSPPTPQQEIGNPPAQDSGHTSPGTSGTAEWTSLALVAAFGLLALRLCLPIRPPKGMRMPMPRGPRGKFSSQSRNVLQTAIHPFLRSNHHAKVHDEKYLRRILEAEVELNIQPSPEADPTADASRGKENQT